MRLRPANLINEFHFLLNYQPLKESQLNFIVFSIAHITKTGIGLSDAGRVVLSDLQRPLY